MRASPAFRYSLDVAMARFVAEEWRRPGCFYFTPRRGGLFYSYYGDVFRILPPESFTHSSSIIAFRQSLDRFLANWAAFVPNWEGKPARAERIRL